MIRRSTITVVLERDHGQCVIDGPRCLGAATVADHRVNRGMGGGRVLDDPAVLVAACGLCNGDKEDATGEWRDVLRDRGVRVLPAATHQSSIARCRIQPIRYPDGTWWFLLSNGRREECSPPDF